MNKIAQIKIFGTTGNQFQGPGTLGTVTNDQDQFNQLISTSIGVLTAIAFIWFFFQLIFGAYSIMNAGSDKQKITDAQKKIYNSIIGIIVVISAIFIAELVGYIFGIDILDPIGLII